MPGPVPGRRYPAYQFGEIVGIELLGILLDHEVVDDGTDVLTGHLPLVQGLIARLRERLRCRLTFRYPQISRSRLTISMAEAAASPPFVAGLGARSLNGLLDAVDGQHAEGDRDAVLSVTCAIPFTHSPATYSKCGVPPRITAPSATIASYSPLAAILSSTSGISKAPAVARW